MVWRMSASLASPRNTAWRMSASLASPRNTTWRISASLASPRNMAWRMSASLASLAYFWKRPFWRVLALAKNGEYSNSLNSLASSHCLFYFPNIIQISWLVGARNGLEIFTKRQKFHWSPHSVWATAGVARIAIGQHFFRNFNCSNRTKPLFEQFLFLSAEEWLLELQLLQS
jgi:hypothetical protein